HPDRIARDQFPGSATTDDPDPEYRYGRAHGSARASSSRSVQPPGAGGLGLEPLIRRNAASNAPMAIATPAALGRFTWG
ncbi:MAG: hypothetical protein KDB13_03580, partial [Microthrixaceae bacterium]|nr:hypothetical protein [Microthrixaceae bacterium]